MFNLPVKFSVMTALYQEVSPQVFLDKTPEECVAIYKRVLPQQPRQAVEFAYGDQAILQVLEKEFEVQVARRQLVFMKSALGAESWLLASGRGLSETLKTSADYGLLEQLTEMIWKVTAGVSTSQASIEERLQLRREIKVLLELYYSQYCDGKMSQLELIKNPKGLRRFFNTVVAQAMYKADGARAMFGAQSRYYHLWLAKQVEFFGYAKAIAWLPYQQTA